MSDELISTIVMQFPNFAFGLICVMVQWRIIQSLLADRHDCRCKCGEEDE